MTDVRNHVESVISSIIVRINSVYPELPIHSVKHLGSGQNNDVYLVNESLVFRFPRNRIAATRLRTEVTILAHLRGVNADFTVSNLTQALAVIESNL